MGFRHDHLGLRPGEVFKGQDSQQLCGLKETSFGRSTWP
jgi:hypothetical protein